MELVRLIVTHVLIGASVAVGMAFVPVAAWLGVRLWQSQRHS